MDPSDFSAIPLTKKQKKQATLRKNKRRGKAAERQAMMRDNLAGYDVKITGRGSDYERKKRNSIGGGSGESELIEIKSGKAKPSPLQKKTQKEAQKKKRIYKVVRPPLTFPF